MFFSADAFFTELGIREKVDISYVTPMPGAFTKPVATKMLSELPAENNIEVIRDFYIERVDNDAKKLISYDEKEIDFDVLTVVPVNMGDEMEVPPVDEFLDMITAGGGEVYACKMAADMFKLSMDDLCEHVKDIITVGDLYAMSGGEGTQIIFT
ncbi:hypothetical protein [uncultured Draconibacterium sp.]|uniref:hypothetical protein n=1 Tax=uncultured Draconibacterium sp. TaxID=1573823 RepID=UPI00326110BE